MTIYLNPTTMTKKEFLKKNGTLVPQDQVSSKNLDDHSEICIVCLVNNGPFTAAGILDGQRDFIDFIRPYDFRPKIFFTVPTSAINAEGGPAKEVT